MKKSNYYKQCVLASHYSVHSRFLTTWIPEHAAIIGKWIKLEDEPNVWWTVEEVFDIRLTKEQVEENSQDYKRTRKASDI